MSDKRKRVIGIVSAIEREFNMIRDHFNKVLKSEELCGRTFYTGPVNSHDVVLTKCGIGKVSASSTVAIMLSVYKCTEIVFLGVAAGLQGRVEVGDVVISTASAQHDFDGRPWVERSVVFSVGMRNIPADKDLQANLQSAVQRVIADDMATLVGENGEHIGKKVLAKLNRTPKILSGVVLSGDQFIADDKVNKDLADRFEDALCVEMEGAAVAQICHEAKVPHVIVRAISDAGVGDASIQFEEFCNTISAPIMLAILQSYLSS